VFQAFVYAGFCNACLGIQDGGAEGIRTPDPHNAIVVLYQLSYDPIRSGADTVKVAYSFVKIYFPLWMTGAH
jgi:hypothetical protein